MFASPKDPGGRSVPGAIHILMADIEGRNGKIPKSAEIVFD